MKVKVEFKKMENWLMTGRVFVISEWLPKPNCQRVVWQQFKELMALTKQSEKGCIRAHTLKQIEHPFALGKSEYTIMLFQEYIDIAAFEQHCQMDYVKRAFKHWIEDPKQRLLKSGALGYFVKKNIKIGKNSADCNFNIHQATR
jgi:quinol monooxygenase YgiN